MKKPALVLFSFGTFIFHGIHAGSAPVAAGLRAPQDSSRARSWLSRVAGPTNSATPGTTRCPWRGSMQPLALIPA